MSGFFGSYHVLHRFSLFLFLIILFSGCSQQTTELPLDLDQPTTFSASGDIAMSNRWWTAFDDSILNKLVDTALHENFTITAAWYRLQAAGAVVKRESSSLFPDLEAYFQAENGRSSSSLADRNSFEPGLRTSYEIDLWGRIRSRVQAEKFRAEASLTDYQAAAISLSAEITAVWFRIQEAASQLELIDEQIKTNEQALVLIRNRFGTGQVRSVDILRQHQLVEATREQRTYVEARLETLKHQLAVLLGDLPLEEMNTAASGLPDLPPLPATGIPVDLVQRRPDVLTAWYGLQAADKDLAAAISNRYPRLSLNASVYATSGSVSDLFDDWAYAVAGNILAPVFYGGELKAEVDRTEALKMEQLYHYGQSVLTAFREVEDALIREQKQRETLMSLEKQIDLSRKTLRQLRSEYLNGMSAYLDVLIALNEEQRLRRDLLTAQLNLLEYRIDLYRALAGSFETQPAVAANEPN